MYAGLTLTAVSGRLVGAHQKIDRTSRRQVGLLLAHGKSFPSIRTILHFEGKNGPDGIKRKSLDQDEPRHFYSPFDATDTALIDMIDSHYNNLVAALKQTDQVVAGFEAAWLAHAIVDGLTPAHHYPYEAKLEELRGGPLKEPPASFKDKVVMPGSNNRETIANNWRMWGPSGLLTTHIAFEWGVASILLPMRFGKRTRPVDTDYEQLGSMSATEYFQRLAKEIAALGIYDDFCKHGWTARLARTVRQTLVPTVVKAVTLIWYKAACDAGLQLAAPPSIVQTKLDS